MSLLEPSNLRVNGLLLEASEAPSYQSRKSSPSARKSAVSLPRIGGEYRLIYFWLFLLGGPPFDIQKVTAHAFETGEWKTSWVPKINHPSIPPEQVEVLSRSFTAGILLAIHDKAYQISDEWNRLLPDYKFTDTEDFLTKAWRGKA